MATIYSDDGVTTTANPLTTDAFGRFNFYVADGRYDLIVASGTVNFTESDVEIADLTQASASDSVWKVESSGLSIVGSSSGAITLAVPAAAGTNTTTFQAATDTVVYKATADTLTNKTLTSPTINGSPSGTGIPTFTLKKGTGGGNYTSTSVSLTDVDVTNLAYTVVIPTGWKLFVSACGACFVQTGNVFVTVALFDTQGSTTLQAVDINLPGTSQNNPFALSSVITGDGNSHTVKLQYLTSNGSDAVGIQNTSSSKIPTMTFILSPSN